MSLSLTGTKTECLSAEVGQIFCVLISVVAHQPYWHKQMTCTCGDSFILSCFSTICHVNCKLFVLCSRFGLVVARLFQNERIWFSDAVLLFVVEWRQNTTFTFTPA